MELATDPRLPSIRLLATDVDATLVRPDGSVDVRVRDLLDVLRRQGVILVLCTGRAQEATDWLARELLIKYCICSNGASVHRDGRLLWDTSVPADLTADIVTWFAERDVACVLTTPHGYLTTRLTPVIERASALRRCRPEVVPAARWRVPSYKLQLWDAGDLYDHCQATFGDRVSVLRHPKYLSVGPLDVDKGMALHRLARQVGVADCEILSIGDDRNDIPMFRHSALAVAVGPAAPVVRAAAHYWLPSTGADAVVPVLRAMASGASGASAASTHGQGDAARSRSSSAEA